MVSSSPGLESDRGAENIDLNMPTEVMLRILHFLPPESLGVLRRVCKLWRLVVNRHDRELFKTSCLSRQWLAPIPNGCVAIEDTFTPAPTLSAEDMSDGPIITAVMDTPTRQMAPSSDRQVTPPGHWISVFASNYNSKKGFWNGELARYGNSPYHEGKSLNMRFGLQDWGECLEHALAAN